MTSGTVLVIGRRGLIATALRERATRDAANHNLQIVCRGRPDFDVLDAAQIAAALTDVAPDVVVNTALFSAVDRAEGERIVARCVNEEGPRQLAELCAARGVPLVHLSTHYVFDGQAEAPYVETDQRKPRTVVGQTVCRGEDAIRATHPAHIILRTAWLYGPRGNNFLTAMLNLAGVQEEVRVADDQFGSPTSAGDLADAVLRVTRHIVNGAVADAGAWGTYHLGARGKTSWHGFARAIFEEAAKRGVAAPALRAIKTAEQSCTAQQPAFSVLNSAKFATAFGKQLPYWRTQVAEAVAAALVCTDSHGRHSVD